MKSASSIQIIWKVWQVKRAQLRAQKDLCGHSNHAVGSNWSANAWAVCHSALAIIVTTFKNFWLLRVHSAVLCILWLLQFCYNPAIPAIYPLIVPKIADATILYSHKHFIVNSSISNWKYLCIHLWQSILE